MHHTAENAYMGLAAQYHLHDDVEKGLSIPKWEFGRQTFTTDGVAQQFDLPLVLADKMFSANGEFRYDDAGHTGLWGDVVLVNGVPWPNLKVYKRKYRFRVLNASISRGYRLQMSNSAPISVIGTDGGLTPQVQATTQLRIGMAERYEIVIDFSKYTPGTKVQLLNLGVPNSTDFDNTGKIMQFQVVDTPAGVPADVTLPSGGPYSLNPNKEVWDLKENAIQGTTKIEVVRQNGEWKIQSTSTSTTSNSGSGSSGGSGSGRSGSGSGGSGSGSGGSGSGSSGSGSSGGGTTKLMTWEDIIASGYKDVVANPASGDVQICSGNLCSMSGGTEPGFLAAHQPFGWLQRPACVRLRALQPPQRSPDCVRTTASLADPEDLLRCELIWAHSCQLHLQSSRSVTSNDVLSRRHNRVCWLTEYFST